MQYLTTKMITYSKEINAPRTANKEKKGHSNIWNVFYMGHGGQGFNSLQRYAQIHIHAFSKLINNKNIPLRLQNNYLSII